MSYSNFSGSVFIPTSTVIPIASIDSYSLPPPSGYVYCDGNYYDPSDPSYSNLFSVIKYNYGQVVKTVDSTPTNYFRVPNLMGQDFDYGDYVTPYKLGSFTTIGGINNLGNGNVNYSNTVTLTLDYLPSHYHQTAAQQATIKASDSGHNHTVNPGTITVSSTDSGHVHSIDTITHNHGAGNGNEPPATGSISADLNYNVKFVDSESGTYASLVPGNPSSTKSLTCTIAGGQFTDSSTTGIVQTESNTVSNITASTIVSGFSTETGNAILSGSADVTVQTSTATGGTTAIDIPVMPSFVMNYLIKL
jgi:hypothetical protein